MRTQRLKYLILILVPMMLIGLDCATASNTAADTQNGKVLLSYGFKAKPATTAAQRAQLRSMPDNQFTVVKQDGRTYYLYPDKKDGRLYAGDDYAYRAYQGYLKNKNLREKGVFVWEVNPSDKSSNKTIQVWHDWSPFDQWR
jgi:hypothetical protein